MKLSEIYEGTVDLSYDKLQELRKRVAAALKTDISKVQVFQSAPSKNWLLLWTLPSAQQGQNEALKIVLKKIAQRHANELFGKRVSVDDITQLWKDTISARLSFTETDEVNTP